MLYPLRFQPVFRRYIWGGNRLASVLNKPIGNESCAESWEIADHNDDQSVVAFGSLQGTTLGQLIEQHGELLLGSTVLNKINSPEVPINLKGRFPLILKFLDANKNLSVQVHPDDRLGARLDPPDLGKTEAWYVMHADPGAKIYAGLKPGVTRDQFSAAIESGTTENLLHSFEPAVGDCVFIRAGTLHAIGSGLLIAEIQQASDTTFRVFDWNRVDSDGNARQLHVEESLEATDFELGPIAPSLSHATKFENAVTIVENDKFVMRKWSISEPVEIVDEKLHIFAVTGGQVRVDGDPCDIPITLGGTILVPACQEKIVLTPEADSEVLDIFLPY